MILVSYAFEVFVIICIHYSRLKVFFVDTNDESYSNLNIFEMVESIYKGFCKSRNVDILKISSEYKKHQMPFRVVEEIEIVFPIVGFLVQQILGIINFQIKIKRFFFPSLVYSPI